MELIPAEFTTGKWYARLSNKNLRAIRLPDLRISLFPNDRHDLYLSFSLILILITAAHKIDLYSGIWRSFATIARTIQTQQQQ